MDFDREEVKNLLRENKCSITFEKVNGDIRKMLCTLNSTFIPKEEVEAGEKRSKIENQDVLPVYDLDVNGWRSFRWNSLKEFVLV